MEIQPEAGMLGGQALDGIDNGGGKTKEAADPDNTKKLVRARTMGSQAGCMGPSAGFFGRRVDDSTVDSGR